MNPAIAITCPVCGSPSVSKHWTKLGYQHKICKNCGLIFIYPLPPPEEIARYYEENFFQGGQEFGYVAYEEERWRHRNYQRDVRKIARLFAGGRLLDAGCAMGDFLDECPPEWEKYGLEMSAYAGNAARSKYGDHIQICPIQETTFPDGYFDCIVLWETINHLMDPCADIGVLGRILKPGGLLAVGVGDAAALVARVMGKYWYQVTPPVHAYHFSRRSLGLLLEKNGFEVLHVEHTGRYASLGACLQNIKCITCSAWMMRLCRTLARLPIARRSVYLNLFDTMYIFARKRS